jgi:hypothetical protein
VDEPGGEEGVFADWVVAAGWDAAGAAFYFFGGSVVCAGDGEIAGEGNRAGRDREANDSARGGDFRDGVAVSRAGICAGISLVTVDGFAARGCAEHPGAFDDAHGCAVLVRRIGRGCRGESSHVRDWIWTTYRPKFLPWPIESYINGVHIFGEPQAWLFPLFPWSAFAFAGLAVGFFLFSDIAKRKEGLIFAALGVAGIVAAVLSVLFDSSRVHLYAVYDYWHSGPNFLLMRVGILLVILFLVYAWCRWGLAQKGFSPIIQLGNTSLLVYWVHIEFVYGRFSILPKGQCSALKATGGLITIFMAMLALSLIRTTWKKWRVRASE